MDNQDYTFLNHIPVGMFLLNENYEVLFWNNCLEYWTDIPHDTIVGTEIGLHFPHLKSPKYHRRLQHIFSGGPPVIFSAQLHKYLIPAQLSDGQYRVQQTTVTAVPAGQDGRFHALFAIQDQTDLTRQVREYRQMRDQALAEARKRQRAETALRQAKEAAEAASRAKSTFLTNMSHELRTPLNAILGFAQLMTNEPNLTDDQQENLQIIDRSGQHLLALINDVLDMSKIKAGLIELHEHAFDLHRLIRGLVEMFELRAKSKDIGLILRLKPDVPRHVWLDENKLRQVIINLLGNAIKFTMQGQVKLRVESEAENERTARLRFVVEDTGPGINADDVKAIFAPFVQSTHHKDNLHDQGGTGLGLAISRQFAWLMGGQISVSSQLGHGSTFELSIPAGVVDSATIEEEKNSRQVIGMEPGQPAHRLLIVEDKVPSRRLLVKTLAPFGFELREATNGQEALELCEAWEPHLIWMDLRMPVMDGYEATRRIRATARGQVTVIVALTASVLNVDEEVMGTEEFDDFLRKPFRRRELFDVLTKHLGVRFVYADDADGAPSAPVETPGPLPAAWLAALQHATAAANYNEMLALIDRVRADQPTLADILAGWASNFEYKKITAFVQQAMERQQ
jgi:two-component system sensor histidine kinase/response regulator